VQDAAWVWQVLAARPPAVIDAAPLRGMRLVRLVGYFDRPLEPTVRAAFDQALAHLRDAGAIIDTGSVETTARIGQTYADIVLPEAAHWHAPYLDARSDRYRPAVRARIGLGRNVSALSYLEARAYGDALREEIDALLSTCDGLVLPTLPTVAPVIGAEHLFIEPDDPAPVPTRAAMLKHTQPFNLTGHPAISLPLQTSGLPIGFQVVGPARDTSRLLAIAKAVETALLERQ
jgi:Asp-tRNA(Asn)/Glu-tRNA(Gln) amidotransferase A subunit family amidase